MGTTYTAFLETRSPFRMGWECMATVALGKAYEFTAEGDERTVVQGCSSWEVEAASLGDAVTIIGPRFVLMGRLQECLELMREEVPEDPYLPRALQYAVLAAAVEAIPTALEVRVLVVER